MVSFFGSWISSLCVALIFFLQIAVLSKSETFLWPQPQRVLWGNGPPIPISSGFQIKAPKQRELSLAARRFEILVSTEKWVPVQVSVTSQPPDSSADIVVEPLQYLQILVDDLEADLQQGVDERYTIVIPDTGGSGNLSASTVWGALHGLQTFSQLVLYNETQSAPIVEHGIFVTDNPLYPYRGLVLDTSRNFFPVKDILRTIDALSYNKLNVFHWHITDSQSFPIELSKEPYLAWKGSYGPQFRYSEQDVEEVIGYARERGVRIVPEIDTPGHTASWGGAYPEIVTCRYQSWMTNAAEPTPGQLNPLHNKTYEVVKNVIDNVASLFPERFYHGGSDEINSNCWNTSVDIQQYLAAAGTMNSLLEKFISTTYPYIISHGKTVVYWEDVLLSSNVNVSASLLPKETTVLLTWNNGPANTKLLTAAGYRTIVASADFYYLDCGHGDFIGNDTRADQQVNPDPGTPSYNYGGDGGSWCAPYKSWQRIYDYDITYNLTEEEARLVLGGAAALWSEQADGTVVDGLVWPRTAALAEALWSGNTDAAGSKRTAEAINRLNDWRYRLVGRGIAAEPLQPLWCLRNPYQCNLS